VNEIFNQTQFQMFEFLTNPWPWYIAGPLIGLIIPFMLISSNKILGVSSNFRHICAACMPANIPFFKYDWKDEGGWNLVFLAGIILGGIIAGGVFANPDPIAISDATISDLSKLGIRDFEGLIPTDLFNWQMILTPAGFTVMVIGGFLVGFGTRYAGGCTSGHAISGLSNLQLGSLIATIGFFVGGLIATHLLYPLLFN
jgi:uncharacterized membrane protein YedE/YeeE